MRSCVFFEKLTEPDSRLRRWPWEILATEASWDWEMPSFWRSCAMDRPVFMPSCWQCFR